MNNTPNDQKKITPKGLTEGETEGARRATGVAPSGDDKHNHVSPPDPEVPEKKLRRRFTAKYKLRILDEADACTEKGQLGALLRKEGLYSSSLTLWRKQRAQGVLTAMSPKKRGRKRIEKNPLAEQVARLQKENQRLKNKLKQAEKIIDVQKKISEILEIPQNSEDHE
jgi:transposase-like protein